MTPFVDICAMKEYESESEIFIGVFRFHALFFITQRVSDDVWSSTDLPDHFLFPWVDLSSIGPDIKTPRHICLGEYMCGSLFHSLPVSLSLSLSSYTTVVM